ncbi:CapA family protein [Bacillus spongiae]|uniref:CapA family protein n=1 Tax=Bacillus spongiae TaxID=2683610 RepID=A0ABU8HJB5_9BACI
MKKRRRIRKVRVIITVVFIIGIGLLLRNLFEQGNESQERTPTPITNKEIQLEAKSFTTEATISAIGDVLLHNSVYEGAKTDSGYDFRPMIEKVKPYLQEPDFLIANQESMPGGVEIGLSSYPSFNSPHEIIDALQEAGVDMVTNANNHSLDRGEKALNSAITYYEEVGMPYTGAFKSVEDQNTVRTFNVNGISLAVLSYTYGTNGIPVPEGKDYMVNLLDENRIIKDIEKVKMENDVDLIVLGLHWGQEYQALPTKDQQTLAQELTDAGADIIFGHHPHVLQPIETRKTVDGREAVIIYSLGNFISGQTGESKDLGGVINVKVNKAVEGTKTTITYPEIEFKPTFVAKDPTYRYMMYPLEEAEKLGLTNHSVVDVNSHMSTYMTTSLR